VYVFKDEFPIFVCVIQMADTSNGKDMFRVLGIGHRSVQNESEIREKIKYSLAYFLSKHREITCVSHLAEGADTWFVEEALKLNIPIEIVLPFPVEEYKKDFSQDGLTIFENIVSKHPYEVYGQLSDTLDETRNKAYLNVSLYNAKRCDVTIALWDGLESRGLGGTKDTIDYLVQANKEFHWIKVERTPSHADDSEIEKDLESFIKYDKIAVKIKNKYHSIWTTGLIFGILAVLVFALNFNFIDKSYPLVKFISSLIEITCIGLSFLFLTVYANKLRKVFIQNRKKAEDLRARIWRNSLLELKKLNKLSSDNRCEINYEELNLARVLWSFCSSQIAYQTNRIKRFKHSLHRMHRILNVLKYLFFAVVISIATKEGLHWLHHADQIKPENTFNLDAVLVFFWMLIPPTFASLEGVIYFNDWKKNIYNSKELILSYEALILLLNNTDTENLHEIEKRVFGNFTFEIEVWLKEEAQKEFEVKI